VWFTVSKKLSVAWGDLVTQDDGMTLHVMPRHTMPSLQLGDLASDTPHGAHHNLGRCLY